LAQAQAQLQEQQLQEQQLQEQQGVCCITRAFCEKLAAFKKANGVTPNSWYLVDALLVTKLNLYPRLQVMRITTE